MADTLMCSKCYQDFPADQITVRKDEQVCPRCGNMLDFLETIKAEQEQLRAGKANRPPPAAKSPTFASAGRSAARRPKVAGGEIGPQIASHASAEPDAQGRKWYAVAVSGGDRKAARTLRDYFGRKNRKALGRVLVPKSWQEVLRAGKYTKQYRRATPGYLLVKCRPDCLDELKRAPAVSTVLPYTDAIDPNKYDEDDPLPEPVPVPAEQVAPFLRRGAKPDATAVKAGDTVQVRAGQWEGQAGEVTLGPGEAGMVRIKVVVMGFPTHIEEPLGNVQKISREG